jgi:hypothetical protein
MLAEPGRPKDGDGPWQGRRARSTVPRTVPARSCNRSRGTQSGRPSTLYPTSPLPVPGGCPGHRKLTGQAAGIAFSSRSQSFLGPSRFQEHSRLLSEAAVTHQGHVWPPRGYLPAIASNSPQGVGVYGEFYEMGDARVCELTGPIPICRHGQSLPVALLVPFIAPERTGLLESYAR